MATVSRPAESKEYVEASVTADVELGAQVVEFAILAGAPVDGTTWTAGAWIGTAGTTRTARILVGQGGTLDPGPGNYTVFVRVTDTPEIPVIPAGSLLLY
jgi:hypothetical protein